MKQIDESAIKITPSGILVPNICEERGRHTEEIQEIITKVPSWIVRWGITLLFGVLLIAVAISVLVRYPDMVKARISLQSSGSVTSVIVNAPGIITNVFVKKDKPVKNGQALIEIQNTVDKKNYILKAPQDGIIGFTSIIQPGTAIQSNQEMFRIHPHNQQLFGLVKIDQNNISKIKEGQDVLINLSNYPSEKYGPLKGKINYLANEPTKDGFFVGKISLNKDNATYKGIRLSNWMTGEAQIITEESGIFMKILANLTYKKNGN